MNIKKQFYIVFCFYILFLNQFAFASLKESLESLISQIDYYAENEHNVLQSTQDCIFICQLYNENFTQNNPEIVESLKNRLTASYNLDNFLVKKIDVSTASITNFINLANSTIAVSQDKSIKVLSDDFTQQVYTVLNAHNDIISGFLLINVTTFLSYSEDGFIKLWNIANGNSIASYDLSIGTIISGAKEQNGTLVFGSDEGKIAFVDKDTYQVIDTIDDHQSESFVYLLENNNILSLSYDGIFKIYDGTTRQVLHESDLEKELYGFTILSNNRFAISSIDTVYIYNASTYELVDTIYQANETFGSIFKLSDSLLAIQSWDKILVWDIDLKSLYKTFYTDDKEITFSHFLTDAVVFSGLYSGQIYIWDFSLAKNLILDHEICCIQIKKEYEANNYQKIDINAAKYQNLKNSYDSLSNTIKSILQNYIL